MKILKTIFLVVTLFYAVRGICETVRCASKPGCRYLPPTAENCCRFDCCTGRTGCGDCLENDDCAWCTSSSKGSRCIEARLARRKECSLVLFSSEYCEAEVTCDYNSKTYRAGDNFPSEDGCNSCTCSSNGQVACTEMFCMPPPETISCSTHDDCENGWCRSGSCQNFQPEGGSCGGEVETEERCNPECSCETDSDDQNALGTCRKPCHMVNCFVDPCNYASCPGRSDAVCRANYCGGCNSEWWVGDVKLSEDDCKLSASSSASVSHPGTCPTVARGTLGICMSSCSSDSDCGSDEKCCSNGCGSTCQQVAVASHAGTCPDTRGAIGTCVEMCTSDASCAVDEKCCSNGCGHVCRKALTRSVVHEGTCPDVSNSVGICIEGCTSDESCGADEKCCSNGCGHVCTQVSTQSTTAKAKCSLPAKTGLCRAHIPRYYYNKTKKTCEEFIYGGCGGNENNFQTYDECMEQCSNAY